jgi:hypothetical protein
LYARAGDAGERNADAGEIKAAAASKVAISVDEC